MNWRHVLYISALCILAGLAASPVHAQARVGEAAVIKNEVVRVVGSATRQINVGDGVLRDEIVRTGLASADSVTGGGAAGFTGAPKSAVAVQASAARPAAGSAGTKPI